MYIRLFRSAIVHEKNNISRMDPALVSTGFCGQTHFHRIGGGPPITFTAPIVVNSSHLVEPKGTASGKMQKVIDGAMIAGEWERFVGGVGMVLNATEFKAQLYMDNLSFSTAYSSPDSSGQSHIFYFLDRDVDKSHFGRWSLQWQAESVHKTCRHRGIEMRIGVS
jgi:hypothetical protein